MRPLKSIRGSVLIVALIFSAVIALVLGSSLSLALISNKLADQAYALNAAQNLADTGFEHALWALDNSGAWTTGGFTSSGLNQYQAVFPSSSSNEFYPLSRGAKGKIKVWVGNSTTTPHVVVQSIVVLGSGRTVSKYAEAYMLQRSYSTGGMVAKNGIDFTGHSTVVDSWVSHDDDDTVTDVPYSTAPGVRQSNAHFATPGMISQQNAKVFGYASIGSDDNSGLSIGATGILSGDLNAANSTVDYTRVTHDFAANFPEFSAPSGGTSLGAISAATNLTGGTSATSPIIYSTSSITIGTSDPINIGTPTTPAYVTLVVTGSVNFNGSAQFIINPGSKLTMYVAGDISMSGNEAIVNGDASNTTATMNMPSNFTLIGTRTAAQITSGNRATWSIKGGSYMSAIVYAPSADITIGGNGDTFGSVVGYTVSMNSGNFHQDESLSNIRNTGLWAVSKWRELQTQADRAAYSTQLNFAPYY